jgi:hypothetical protein
MMPCGAVIIRCTVMGHSMSIQQEVRKFLMRRRFLWLHWALSDEGRVETCIANATPLIPSRLPAAHQCD